jgi:hypothetical protein
MAGVDHTRTPSEGTGVHEVIRVIADVPASRVMWGARGDDAHGVQDFVQHLELLDGGRYTV